MTVSSSQQLDVFLVCILFGVLSGIIFDFGRSVRKVYGGQNVLTITEDIIFMLIYIAALIVICYFFDEGRIRYYHILGAFSGVMLYALLLSRAVLKLFSCVHCVFIKAVLRPFVRLIKFIFTPFKLLGMKIIALLKKQRRKAKRVLKIIQDKKKRMKKIIKML